MTRCRDRSHRWGIVTLLTCLVTAPAPAADWQEASVGPRFVARVDMGSVIRDGRRISAWIWYKPVKRVYRTWLFRRSNTPQLQGDIKEQVSVDCRTRDYMVHDFEGSPLGGRHLWRAAEVVPGSEEETVLVWLCKK